MRLATASTTFRSMKTWFCFKSHALISTDRSLQFLDFRALLINSSRLSRKSRDWRKPCTRNRILHRIWINPLAPPLTRMLHEVTRVPFQCQVSWLANRCLDRLKSSECQSEHINYKGLFPDSQFLHYNDLAASWIKIEIKFGGQSVCYL